MNTIQAERTVTASTNDVLGATQLRQAPGPGAVAIFLASTAIDSEASVIVGSVAVKSRGIIGKVATNAQISTNDDTPSMVQVRGGETITVDVVIATAGTIRVLVVWMGLL